MVAVHAGMAVEQKSIVFASLGAHLRCTVEEGQLAFKVGFMCMSAARAHFGVGDDLPDVKGTQLGHSAPVIQGKVIRFEFLWQYRGRKGEWAVEGRC